MKTAMVILFFIFLQAFNPAEAQVRESRTILFFGDSITAGYGIDMEEAFPALIASRIDSLNLAYRSVNAGLSGETSAGGLRRVEWVLRQGVDIFVLELGGNDGLRGIDPESTKQNLQGIIDKVAESNPEATLLLTGMQAPPNMGESYTRRFQQIFEELASENSVIFMPFILERVAGDPDLNLPDGIHPTEEGHRLIADHLWEYLYPMLSR
ncbi:MAG: arylesterase [Balneolaceae bacterium]|nr:MAG: arylesterase [Balneolaceae bacterium]